MAPRAAPAWGLAWTVGLAAALASGWMIVTLTSAESVAAGWRHELICSVLAALAIYLATWAQGRRWPGPAAVVATLQLALLGPVLLLPFARLEALGVLGILIAGAVVVCLPLELRASRGAPRPLVALVLLGLVDLLTVTPGVVVLAVTGVLR